MRHLLVAVLLVVALAPAGPGSAQPAPDGSLDRFPFEPPFPIVADRADGAVLALVLDAPFDACVEYLSDALRTGRPLSDGWTIGGRGLDADSQDWHFGLLHGGRTLYHLAVRRDAAGCRLELETQANVTPGGRYRWAFPPLRLSDGSAIEVDPFVVAN